MDPNAQHAPGPWSIREGEIWGNNDFIGIVLRTEAWTSGQPVHTEDEANACLIAAAPELLQTVKDLCGLAAMSRGQLHQYRAALDSARALIARAEGGAP